MKCLKEQRNRCQYIYPRELRMERDCDIYRGLPILYEENEELERIAAIQSSLSSILYKAGNEGEALNMWSAFLAKEYDRIPGCNASIAEADRKNALDVKVVRFISFFYKMGWRVTDTSYHFSFEFCKREVSSIIHMIVDTGAGVVGMNISFGTNPYSDQARSERNKTCNAIELSCMAAGLSKQGKYPAVAAVCYLTSKDDRSRNFAEEFEGKPGKNIAMASYASFNDAVLHLQNAMGFSSRKDCKTCYKADVCNASLYMTSETKKEQSNVSEAAVSNMKYTAAQKKVINFKENAMCVVAVPGAGKTKSLVLRLLELIKSGVNPSKILFVTFTKKACEEIRERVGKSDVKKQPTILTFHSLAAQILKDNSEVMLGKSRLATKTDRLDLIEQAINLAPRIEDMSYEFPEGEFGICRRLDSIFEKHEHGLQLPDNVVPVYKKYKELYKSKGYYSYDEMIPLARKVLEDKMALKYYQDKWEYFMADEYQDVDDEQAELLYTLARKSGNIVVVGDDDQAVYGWRGGNSSHMLYFDQDFPDATAVFMEDNFRTGGGILMAANQLIEHNEERFNKCLHSAVGDGAPPYYKEHVTDEMLANYILNTKNVDPSDICILARTNKSLEILAEKFSKYGIKALPPRTFLIKDTVFLMLYDLFKIYASKSDPGSINELSLYRLLTALGQKLDLNGLGKNESLYNYLTRVNQIMPMVPCYIESAAKNISGFLVNKKERPSEKIYAALNQISFERTLDVTLKKCFMELTGDMEHPALSQILDLIDECKIVTVNDYIEMCERMFRFKDDTEVEYSPKKGYVNLLTCHKSKGKEFPFVIIYCVEDFDDSPESRNLLYVAMTRAKKVLLLCKGADKPAPLMEELLGTYKILEGGGR